MSSEIDRIKRVIKITNEISPTFCLAKWHHTSIYLHTGQTHSCYHPRPHAILLDEIKDNPSALHNTLEKKKERAQMLVGEKPKGCQYCWNVESLSDTHISDRHDRNANIFKPERVDEILNSPWDFNINPEYIEIAFSNECNFKCGYCHPMSSSSFQSEIKKFGPYNTVKNHTLNIEWFKPFEEEVNPYIDAWWKWWPEVSKTLNILRITGGEPLMHRSTWRLFDALREEPKPHLELNLNSNLGVKSSMVEKLADNVKDMSDNHKIKTFKLFSSMDSWGERAEYIRTGLDTDLWEKNLDIYITKTNAPVSIMCTFNILSVTSFISFLQKVLDWRAKYQPIMNPGGHGRRIRFDTPYLKEPLQYDMMILPKEEFLPHFDAILTFIDSNRDEQDPTKFTDMEYEKFRRVRDYFATANYEEERVKEGRIDFYNWFTEYDRRRDVNFLEIFPEMENFWNQCKNLAKEKNE
jgi:organic radical activating enzyme